MFLLEGLSRIGNGSCRKGESRKPSRLISMVGRRSSVFFPVWRPRWRKFFTRTLPMVRTMEGNGLFGNGAMVRWIELIRYWFKNVDCYTGSLISI